MTAARPRPALFPFAALFGCGGGPGEIDLATASGRRGQVGGGGRGVGALTAGSIPALPPRESKRRGIRVNPDIAGGIGTVSSVHELGYAISEYFEGFPVGGAPPLISGDDRGSEELDPSEDPAWAHLVDPRRTRAVGV